jgi:hypothetical protein
VLVADAGHDGGDVAILPVERLAALGIVPGQRESRRSIVDTEFGLLSPVAFPEAQAVM